VGPLDGEAVPLSLCRNSHAVPFPAAGTAKTSQWAEVRYLRFATGLSANQSAMRDHSRKKPDLVSIAFVFGNCAAASVIGSQPSATRNQCRLTIAVQKARVVVERVVFRSFRSPELSQPI
jgi:hypothetical protein